MKQPIEVPPMGESISEVVIASFLVKSGEVVAEGDEIVEIETDKVNQPLYATASGKIEWSVAEGDAVKIGAVIGQIDASVEAPKKEQKKKEDAPPPKPAPKPSGEKLRMKEGDFLAAAPSPAPKEEKPKPKVGGEKRVPLSPIRKTIARRLVDSLHSSAMLTTYNEADMSAIIRLRKTYQEQFVKTYGVKLGFMSFFVQAVVSAMQTYPDFNAYLDGDTVVYRDTFDIGIAVGSDRGLVVPVIRGADKLSLHEIEQEIVNYAEKARSGRIAINDLEGGGFTISNGGVYGSLFSAPILNPPQVGILGMGKIMERPMVVNSEIVARPMMYLAMSYDHRLIDGKGAVTFLVHIKERLEEPAMGLF